MTRLIPLILIGILLPLYGENYLLQTDLFMTRRDDSKDRNMNQLLSAPETKQLFSSRILCTSGADSSFFLFNYFGSRQSGFSAKISPQKPANKKNNRKISSEFHWHFAPEGPFQASGTEGFYEGTVISNTRLLLPDLFSPLGITRATSTENLYLPAITYHVQPEGEAAVFQRNSNWELTLKITSEGEKEQVFTCKPVYHRGRFPVQTTPGSFQCRIYQHGKISVLNAVYCRELGKRKDGSPVTEQLSLTLCLKIPENQKELLIAEMTSFCASAGVAYGKLPGSGGKKLRYQLFLSK